MIDQEQEQQFEFDELERELGLDGEAIEGEHIPGNESSAGDGVEIDHLLAAALAGLNNAIFLRYFPGNPLTEDEAVKLATTQAAAITYLIPSIKSINVKPPAMALITAAETVAGKMQQPAQTGQQPEKEAEPVHPDKDNPLKRNKGQA